MIARVVVLFSLVAVPVCGQPRVYTNADLGQPLTWSAPPPSREQLTALKAREFVAPMPLGDGPRAIVLHSDVTAGPFGPLELSPVRPLSDPWAITTWNRRGPLGGYGSYNGYGGVWRADEGYGARDNRPRQAPGASSDHPRDRRESASRREHVQPPPSAQPAAPGPHLAAPPSLGFPGRRAPAAR